MEKIFRNKNFLNFLYLLTQAKGHLSYSMMSRLALDSGKSLSKQTIKVWFRELSKGNDFSYYPITEYRTFNLVPITIIFKGQPIDNSKSYFPKCVFQKPIIGINQSNVSYISHYLIPEQYSEKIQEELSKEPNIIEVIETQSETILYNKLHLIYNREGHFLPDSGGFTEHELNKLNVSPKIEFKNKDKEFLKYVLLEKINRHSNSYDVWEALKEKIDAWTYLKRDKRDTIGVKKIQDTLRRTKYLDNKLYYKPLTQRMREIFFAGKLNPQQVRELTKTLGKNSVSVSVWKGKKSVISAQTNLQGLLDASNVVQKYRSKVSMFAVKRLELEALNQLQNIIIN